MHQQDKIAGMDMLVEHSTVVKSMLVRGIMCAVQPEAQTFDYNVTIFLSSSNCFLVLPLFNNTMCCVS